MGFMDNFMKKTSELAGGAKQMAMEQTELVKLNSQISTAEKKRTQAYLDMGKKYAELHRADYDMEFREFMEEIFAREKEIADCNARIREVKGIRTCPSCGAEVPKASAFCAACGCAMPQAEAAAEPAEPAGPVCAGCGEQLEPGAKFCPACGCVVSETPEA